MRKHQKSIFLFRRDLRLDDNTGLIDASRSSVKVIPCFIVDTRILKKSRPKFSNFRIQFLKDCLFDLNDQLKAKRSRLHIFSGNPEKICKCDPLFCNCSSRSIRHSWKNWSLNLLNFGSDFFNNFGSRIKQGIVWVEDLLASISPVLSASLRSRLNRTIDFWYFFIFLIIESE